MKQEQATKATTTAEMANKVINAAPTAALKAQAEEMLNSGKMVIAAGIPKPAPAALQQPDPKAEAKALQDEIQRKTDELKKCLEVLTHKKKLSDHRNQFLYSLDQLEEMRKAVKADSGEFETKNGTIRFFKNANNYRTDEAILSISNTQIVLDMLDFIEVKIKAKIETIETELIQ